MMLRRTILSLACFASIAVGACSSTGSGNGNGSSTSGGGSGISGYAANGSSGGSSLQDATTETAACKVYSVCDLVTPQDIDSLAAFGVDGGQSSVEADPDQLISDCLYLSTATFGAATIQIACSSQQPDETFEIGHYADAGFTAKPVSGIGDGALEIANPATPTNPPMLTVFVGTTITISITVTPPTGSSLDPLAAEETIARDLIPRL